MNIACDLEEVAFMAVALTVLFVFPKSNILNNSSTDFTGTIFKSLMYIPLPGFYFNYFLVDPFFVFYSNKSNIS